MNQNEFTSYLSPGKVIQVPANVWQNEQQYASNMETTLTDNINDSYMTADDTGNNTTQFFSVLEESTTETILHDMSQISLETSDSEFTFAANTTACPDDEDEVVDEGEDGEGEETNQEVVIFKTPNSDTWYGLQVAQDDEGHLQKYQYELVQNADGQFESVHGTIQLVPLDTDPLTVAKQLEAQEAADHVDEEPEDEPELDEHTALRNEIQDHVYIKQEFLNYEDVEEPHGLVVEEEEQEEEEEEEGAVLEPEVGDEFDEINVEKVLKQELHSDFETGHFEYTTEDLIHHEDAAEEDVHYSEVQHGDGEEIFGTEPDEDEHEQHHQGDVDVQEEEEEEVEMGEVRSVNRGILESALEGIYSPTKNALESENDENVETIQFFINEDEEEEGGIDTDEDELEFRVEQLQNPSPKRVVKKTIALYPISGSKEVKSKTLTTIEVPFSAQRTAPKLVKIEKNFDPPLKSLNRLKRPHASHSTQQINAIVAPEKENLQVNKAMGVFKNKNAFRRLSTTKKYEPVKLSAEAQKKQLQRAPWNVNKMISQTTIIEAPVRQERLPRKQKIEPLERVGEELVFQHVVVSSNGVVETKVDGVVKERKVLMPTECIQLSDSEDEQTRRTRKRNAKRKQIEIVISDSEEEDDSEAAAPMAISETAVAVKVVNNCPKCSKSFPSIGSLRTHLQYHTFEESKKKAQGKCSRKEQLDKVAKDHKPTAKYKCQRCDEAFINIFLLSKHEQLHDAKMKNECNICRKLFNNQMQLNIHKRTHVKDAMYKNTTTSYNGVKLSPKKNKEAAGVAAASCNNNKKNRISPKSTTSLPSKPTASRCSMMSASKLYKCYSCNAGFSSKLLLDTHVIKNCVKSPRRLNRSMAPNSKSTTAVASSAHAAYSTNKFNLNATVASDGQIANRSPGSTRNTSVKKTRIPLNAGIPAMGNLRNAFLNMKRRIQEDEQ